MNLEKIKALGGNVPPPPAPERPELIDDQWVMWMMGGLFVIACIYNHQLIAIPILVGAIGLVVVAFGALMGMGMRP